MAVTAHVHQPPMSMGFMATQKCGLSPTPIACSKCSCACCRTWAATLLQSSNVAWEYGISGPFWCGPCMTVCAARLSFLHWLLTPTGA